MLLKKYHYLFLQKQDTPVNSAVRKINQQDKLSKHNSELKLYFQNSFESMGLACSFAYGQFKKDVTALHAQI